MKCLFFIALLLLLSRSQAYVVLGVRTTILVEGINKNKIQEIWFEGCDKDSCSKPEIKSKCTKSESSKYFCHLSGQNPFFVRFTVRLSTNKLFSSKFVGTNGESSLSNFKLEVTQTAVMVTQVKGVL